MSQKGQFCLIPDTPSQSGTMSLCTYILLREILHSINLDLDLGLAYKLFGTCLLALKCLKAGAKLTDNCTTNNIA